MKKLYSLIRACMTSDMSIFKIKSKKHNILLPILLSFCFMFAIWSFINVLFEQLAPLHMQYLVLSLFVFSTAIMTIIQGVYKSGPLMFNCKDDDLLLSLPIKRSTILFVRIFKFYVYELMFNTLFMIPLILCYIRWGESVNWSFYLTSIIMEFLLPIIPIIISCILSFIISSISSKFKYKNLAQTISSILMILLIFSISYNGDKIFNYLIQNETSINNIISKIYYPAGVYSNLVLNFKLLDLVIFIISNISLLLVGIIILNKFYFKINSRIKKITTSKKTNINKLTIKSKNKTMSLINKEIKSYFKTPVLIINSGFSLVLFIILVIGISVKSNEIIKVLIEEMNIEECSIYNNLSLFILLLISITSYMTSITNSFISLEGKNINILKSIPVSTKKILLSKVYSGLFITTPVFLIGTIIICISLKITIIETILLIILTILIPLVSHFIGLIINLKYPKLDAENSTEIVKQSMSSFISVMIGVLLLILSYLIISNLIGLFTPTNILIITILIYLIINIILYLILSNYGVKKFNQLSV